MYIKKFAKEGKKERVSVKGKHKTLFFTDYSHV